MTDGRGGRGTGDKYFTLRRTKEPISERADITLKISMFVTAEKERRMFRIFFLSSFPVPAILSKDSKSSSRPWKLWPKDSSIKERWPFQPALCKSLLIPASLGWILSEKKGDRRHCKRQIQILYCWWFFKATNKVQFFEFPPLWGRTTDDVSYQTLSITHLLFQFFTLTNRPRSQLFLI